MLLGKSPKYKGNDWSDPLHKLYFSGAVLLGVFTIGVIGYTILGEGRWTILDCLYMTVITLTTVGYGEVLPINNVVGGRIFTMVLLVLGMGTILFFISTLTAFIIEGELRDILRRRRMDSAIKGMKNHIVLCGLGETGLHVAEEMFATKTPFVMIDLDEERLESVCMSLETEIPYLIGDASDDDTLLAAGIINARGIISCCTEDKDNAFVVVSAKQLNPGLRIVTKAVTIQSERKLRRAGANKVVSTNFIGGMRLASEMLRPAVTAFQDKMLHDAGKSLRIDEVDVNDSSPFVGKTLRDLDIRRKVNLTVLAISNIEDQSYLYNPPGNYVLKAGMTLICMGEIDSIAKFRKLACI